MKSLTLLLAAALAATATAAAAPGPPLTCATVKCAAGTECTIIDNKPHCAPPLTCATVLCTTGTYCEMFDNKPRCVPFPTTTTTTSVPALSARTPPTTLSTSTVPAGGPAAAETGTPCGENNCAKGEFCCNESCGICVDVGGFCTTQFCQ